MSPLRRARFVTTSAVLCWVATLNVWLTLHPEGWVLALPVAWLCAMASLTMSACAIGWWIEVWLSKRPGCDWQVGIDPATPKDGRPPTVVWYCPEHRNVYGANPPDRCPTRGVWT